MKIRQRETRTDKLKVQSFKGGGSVFKTLYVDEDVIKEAVQRRNKAYEEKKLCALQQKLFVSELYTPSYSPFVEDHSLILVPEKEKAQQGRFDFTKSTSDVLFVPTTASKYIYAATSNSVLLELNTVKAGERGESLDTGRPPLEPLEYSSYQQEFSMGFTAYRTTGISAGAMSSGTKTGRYKQMSPAAPQRPSASAELQREALLRMLKEQMGEHRRYYQRRNEPTIEDLPLYYLETRFTSFTKQLAENEGAVLLHIPQTIEGLGSNLLHKIKRDYNENYVGWWVDVGWTYFYFYDDMRRIHELSVNSFMIERAFEMLRTLYMAVQEAKEVHYEKFPGDKTQNRSAEDAQHHED